ncbi:pre-mRNA-splicing factor CWC22 [Angomonas deanei]|uniref:MIF4G domain/MA3 domain containing protein, putative n=1 Tax=Angomonas deanei TaxID=59799 RepID=A0A7G2C1L0_9TRYP|nr:pre-mRNA-splicing factor CWC22 [Angomonas deanei]CAD2213101.1 MIF4G domain/MA3 domain containing protein, putative [Angomonas deanei]|eukprot:EPY35480.1 pre-mRNA-splicing factor CWC22 [Angomonas deanei]
MSRYVPPSLRKNEEEVDLSDTSSVAYQQASWKALSRSINGIMNRLTVGTLESSCTELFRENIVRGRGLLARSLMNVQQSSPDLTPVVCALVSRINKQLPDIVFLLCKRLVDSWGRAYRRRDWLYLENTSRFLGELYVFQVIEVDVIYQLLLKLLLNEKRTDEDVDQAVKLFRYTFRAMTQRDRATFYQAILTPFRSMLAGDDGSPELSTRSEALIENCLTEVKNWEKVKNDQPVIKEQLVLFDLDEQTHHELDMDEQYNTEEGLNKFVADPNFEEHEEKYEEIRKTILGEDWEEQLLEEAAAAEASAEEEEENNNNEAPEQQQQTGAEKHTTIDENERKVRKEVYLAMRSSLRADEAVHKILKQMRPQTERTVCYMVIEGCCEEKTYRKIYAMIAERLCKSNARFQAFFVDQFHSRYNGSEELTIQQIEYTARIYSHLLRTDSLYWSRVLCAFDILHNNESQRLFIQYFFGSLIEEMGATNTLERFRKDVDLRSQMGKLFPIQADTPSVERAVNLFVAMNVGDLAAPLRAELDRRKEDRKRGRDD